MLECVVNISEGRDAAVLAELEAAARRRSARPPHRPRPPSQRVHAGGRGRPAPAGGDGRGAAEPRRPSRRPSPTGRGRRGALRAPRRTRRWPTRWRRATPSPPGPAPPWPCRASATAPKPPCPKCAATPSPTSTPTTDRPRPIPPPGAMCVGARPVLVAYNVWLAAPDIERRPRPRRQPCAASTCGPSPSSAGIGCR